MEEWFLFSGVGAELRCAVVPLKPSTSVCVYVCVRHHVFSLLSAPALRLSACSSLRGENVWCRCRKLYESEYETPAEIKAAPKVTFVTNAAFRSCFKDGRALKRQ